MFHTNPSEVPSLPLPIVCSSLIFHFCGYFCLKDMIPNIPVRMRLGAKNRGLQFTLGFNNKQVQRQYNLKVGTDQLPGDTVLREPGTFHLTTQPPLMLASPTGDRKMNICDRCSWSSPQGER